MGPVCGSVRRNSTLLRPDQARQILAVNRVAYVMVCGPRPPNGLDEPERSLSLWGKLAPARFPDWLEPVGNTAGQAFAVYRVKR